MVSMHVHVTSGKKRKRINPTMEEQGKSDSNSFTCTESVLHLEQIRKTLSINQMANTAVVLKVLLKQTAQTRAMYLSN